MEDNTRMVAIVSLLVILAIGLSIVFSVHQLKESEYDKCLDKCGWIDGGGYEQAKEMELEVGCIDNCAIIILEEDE